MHLKTVVHSRKNTWVHHQTILWSWFKVNEVGLILGPWGIRWTARCGGGFFRAMAKSQRKMGDWGHCTPMTWKSPYICGYVQVDRWFCETFVVGSFNGSFLWSLQRLVTCLKPVRKIIRSSIGRLVSPTGIRTGVSYPWPTWRLGWMGLEDGLLELPLILTIPNSSSDCWVSISGSRPLHWCWNSW